MAHRNKMSTGILAREVCFRASPTLALLVLGLSISHGENYCTLIHGYCCAFDSVLYSYCTSRI